MNPQALKSFFKLLNQGWLSFRAASAEMPPWRSGCEANWRGRDESRTPEAKPPGRMARAAVHENVKKGYFTVLGRPGSDLLFRVLGRSTIGSEAFNDRVRDGIGFGHLDIATRPAKDRRRRMKLADRHART